RARPRARRAGVRSRARPPVCRSWPSLPTARRAGPRTGAWLRREAGRSRSTCRGRPSRTRRSAAGSCVPAAAGTIRAQMRPDRAAPSSEIPFLLLALHRGEAVMIDEAAAPLGEPAFDQLADDVRDGRRLALDRARQRVAAERPEADRPGLRLLAR